MCDGVGLELLLGKAGETEESIRSLGKANLSFSHIRGIGSIRKGGAGATWRLKVGDYEKTILVLKGR